MDMNYGLENPENKEALERLAPKDTDEAAALEPKLMDIPGLGEVLVGGDPLGIADKLNDDQGDNILDARGDCGLVSVANILTQAGLDVTENEVVVEAVGNRLCQYSTELEPEENGATNALHRQALLNAYGVPSSLYSDYTGNKLSLEGIAEYVEAGHGVNIDVNAGYAWNDANYIDEGGINHSIIVTGTLRDPETGELKGLVVCDSGLNGVDSNARVMTVDTLNDSYVRVDGASAVVTDRPICA